MAYPVTLEPNLTHRALRIKPLRLVHVKGRLGGRRHRHLFHLGRTRQRGRLHAKHASADARHEQTHLPIG